MTRLDDFIDTISNILEDENFQNAILYMATDLVVDPVNGDDDVLTAHGLYETFMTIVKTGAASFDAVLKDNRKDGREFRPDVTTFRKEGAGRPKSERTAYTFADLAKGKKVR